MKKQVLLSGLFTTTIIFSQINYTLDKNHARVGFSASHFAVSQVEGTFGKFDAMLSSNSADFSDAKVELRIDASSIDTDNDMRDKDLRSEDWLDVVKYPEILFKSSSFKKAGNEHYKMGGEITIKGKSRPIIFDVRYNGKTVNPMTKKELVGFTITGSLNREDFAVGTATFDKVVGKEVQLRSNVEFILENGGNTTPSRFNQDR